MISAVVVAGGEGERFGRDGGKQLAAVAGVPLLAWTLRAVAACPEVDETIVVCHPARLEEYRASVTPFMPASAVARFVAGGDTRQASVAAGLAEARTADVVVIHDGARPLVTPTLVSEVLAALADDPSTEGAVAGHPACDTLKRVGPDGIVETTLDRRRTWEAQTPQAFRAAALREAHAAAERDGFVGTDDASLVERLGRRVRMVPAPRDNVKVTQPEDLAMVEALMAARTTEA